MTGTTKREAETAELLPCPFCKDGGIPLLERSNYSTFVFCTVCGCEGNSFSSGTPGVDDSSPEAISAWNTRASLATPAVPDKEVRRAIDFMQMWLIELYRMEEIGRLN